jgi:tRNA pseudouridine13 synthase
MRETFDKTDGDPVATLAVFPRTDALGRERTVLQGLKRYGRDKPLEAIRCLHFNVRMFWINAYQSLVWNAMASERIKLLGCTAVEGDLYKDENNGEVKVAKKDDVINIKQVVLPLPGSNIRYPENIIGKLYERFLKEDGVEFRKGHTLESSAKGGYRNLVSTAKDLTWEPIDDEVVFCGDRRNTVKNDEITNARFKFVLQSGSYATMFLRELMVTTSGRESHCE